MGWSKCSSFSVDVKGDIKEVLEKTTKEAARNGVIIKGNDKKGTVTHSDVIDGSYTVKTDEKTKVSTITFDLSENSIFVDCKDVKEKVTDYFKGK